MVPVFEQSTGHLPELAVFPVFGDLLDLGDDSVPFGLDHVVDPGKPFLPDIAFYDPFEELELSVFHRGHKGDGNAHVPGPARTADPVDAGIGIVGKRVVNNMGQVDVVDYPAGSSDDNIHTRSQLSDLLNDRLPAVYGGDAHRLSARQGIQLPGHLDGQLPGGREDQGLDRLAALFNPVQDG